MRASSWNNLISIPLVTSNGFQDELVAMYSFFTYKCGFEPSWIFSPIKSKVSAETKARGTVGKAFMEMNKTTKTGGLNVCYSYIFLEVIIVISFLKTACFKKKWLYSNKYLFIKLAITEVEYELLKCLWGAGLFFFCQVSVKNKNRRRCSKAGGPKCKARTGPGSVVPVLLATRQDSQSLPAKAELRTPVTCKGSPCPGVWGRVCTARGSKLTVYCSHQLL